MQRRRNVFDRICGIYRIFLSNLSLTILLNIFEKAVFDLTLREYFLLVSLWFTG